ncbi:hypothetical protein [Lentilactobacillus kribbianus]|uniref:hypothetical protein n=1 Tax=Lentilactobacillus kribbianus TaxID=2729622 RepID=UPI001556A362|nr:hypothetical protein [Lentilactobacillus kribbianus]
MDWNSFFKLITIAGLLLWTYDLYQTTQNKFVLILLDTAGLVLLLIGTWSVMNWWWIIFLGLSWLMTNSWLIVKAN